MQSCLTQSLHQLPRTDHEQPLQQAHATAQVGLFDRLAEQSPITVASSMVSCQLEGILRIPHRVGETFVPEHLTGTIQRLLLQVKFGRGARLLWLHSLLLQQNREASDEGVLSIPQHEESRRSYLAQHGESHCMVQNHKVGSPAFTRIPMTALSSSRDHAAWKIREVEMKTSAVLEE